MPQSKKPAVVTTKAGLREAMVAARAGGGRIGLVPTMGALHAGHLSLVAAAVAECDFTVVTVFVNPTQFGPGEDYRRYPRTLDADLAALAPYGVDLVFAPPVDEMYAPGHAAVVDAGPVAVPLEGEHRPGHFTGVATVVLKLFNLAPADVAYFGQKDYQQTLVVRRMVEDLDVPIEIRLCPTVREEDGLALSSRNAYLSPAERRHAPAIWRSLALAEKMVAEGRRDVAEIIEQMRGVLLATGALAIDYVALVDPETLAPVAEVKSRTLAAVAATIGRTRLIDNHLIG